MADKFRSDLEDTDIDKRDNDDLGKWSRNEKIQMKHSELK